MITITTSATIIISIQGVSVCGSHIFRTVRQTDYWRGVVKVNFQFYVVNGFQKKTYVFLVILM